MTFRAVLDDDRWCVAWGEGSLAVFDRWGRIETWHHKIADRQWRATAVRCVNRAATEALKRHELPLGLARSDLRKAFCETVAEVAYRLLDEAAD